MLPPLLQQGRIEKQGERALYQRVQYPLLMMSSVAIGGRYYFRPMFDSVEETLWLITDHVEDLMLPRQLKHKPPEIVVFYVCLRRFKPCSREI